VRALRCQLAGFFDEGFHQSHFYADSNYGSEYQVDRPPPWRARRPFSTSDARINTGLSRIKPEAPRAGGFFQQIVQSETFNAQKG
jgi:hypothetical protein